MNILIKGLHNSFNYARLRTCCVQSSLTSKIKRRLPKKNRLISFFSV